MKNLSILFLFLATTFLLVATSCGKDEPSNTDVSSGSVTAKVDGQNWSSKNTVDGAVFSATQGSHLISGYGADGSFISLNIPVVISAGQTYTAANAQLTAQYKPSLAGATAYITAGPLGSGSVTFTEFSDNKVKGTFLFTGVLVDQLGNMTELKVENGVFDFNL